MAQNVRALTPDGPLMTYVHYAVTESNKNNKQLYASLGSDVTDMNKEDAMHPSML